MRETGGRAELQIQVNLLSLTTHLCARHATLHRKHSLEFLGGVDMHHLHLTYLAGRTILALLKK